MVPSWARTAPLFALEIDQGERLLNGPPSQAAITNAFDHHAQHGIAQLLNTNGRRHLRCNESESFAFLAHAISFRFVSGCCMLPGPSQQWSAEDMAEKRDVICRQ